MSQGDKSAYTAKQKRQAQHIVDSERESGKSKKDAQRIAWATVNKQDGGGKKASSKSAAKTKDKPKPKSKTKSDAKAKSASTQKKSASKAGSKKKTAAKSKK